MRKTIRDLRPRPASMGFQQKMDCAALICLCYLALVQVPDESLLPARVVHK